MCFALFSNMCGNISNMYFVSAGQPGSEKSCIYRFSEHNVNNLGLCTNQGYYSGLYGVETVDCYV